ncbi:MAG: hypothetical protein P4M11_14730 [Candidatus Pacebacteria bacterium]|nr:hypothetical protein [Candidatus Paceibacterota bacterium]
MMQPQFQIHYPQLEEPMPQKPATTANFFYPQAVRLQSDKQMLMLAFCLLGAVALVVLSTVYLIMLAQYIIEQKHQAVIPGFLEGIIYVVLFFNYVYAVGVYYLASLNESSYKAAEEIIFYVSILYEAVHIIVPGIVVIMMLMSVSYAKELLMLIILPDIIEIVIFGLCAYGFHSLYTTTTAYVLVPSI